MMPLRNSSETTLIFSGEGSVLEKTEKYVEAHLSLLMEKPDPPLFVLTEIHRDPERFFRKFYE